MVIVVSSGCRERWVLRESKQTWSGESAAGYASALPNVSARPRRRVGDNADGRLRLVLLAYNPPTRSLTTAATEHALRRRVGDNAGGRLRRVIAGLRVGQTANFQYKPATTRAARPNKRIPNTASIQREAR